MKTSTANNDALLALGRLTRLLVRLFWVGWVVAGCCGLQAAEPVISNVRVLHRPGTLDLEVTYDLAVENALDSRIVLSVSTNKAASFTELTNRVKGDGWPLRPGPGQKLVWNPPASWLGRPPTELQFQLKVVGGGPPGMALVKPGQFTMGSSEYEKDRDGDEGPQTEVTITKGYWLGKYEVTQREWESVMGNNPSRFKGDPDLPVEQVRWEEAMEYCRRVTRREREAGRLPEGYEYRLPTEAEWEYACRAGTKTATAFGKRLDSTQADFDGNYPYNGAAKGPYVGKTTKVGSYPANAWGLHDMHGNVWEWCLDWYEERLPGGAVTNPTGPKMGSDRVNRGGSWNDFGWGCRSAYRGRYSPSNRRHVLGFRAACAPVLP